ncbi:hypothetical protein E2C01_016403 [Portunus trituberculatus]|uniref:Uncharacterized protein n=1 Tax=Portunus trituberculatus TaxID=210409 RepID=A0A5B7DQH3_PORTR|nr:hypothetical protein [Portunus trituberculatus]
MRVRSSPKNSRNTPNLLEQGTRRHCFTFMCLHPIQVHVLLRNILMCMLENLTYPVRNSMRVHHMPKKAGASRTTIPGPMKVIPDSSDWAQKLVPLRVPNVLCKSRNGEVGQRFITWKLSLR